MNAFYQMSYLPAFKISNINSHSNCDGLRQLWANLKANMYVRKTCCNMCGWKFVFQMVFLQILILWLTSWGCNRLSSHLFIAVLGTYACQYHHSSVNFSILLISYKGRQKHREREIHHFCTHGVSPSAVILTCISKTVTHSFRHRKVHTYFTW